MKWCSSQDNLRIFLIKFDYQRYKIVLWIKCWVITECVHFGEKLGLFFRWSVERGPFFFRIDRLRRNDNKLLIKSLIGLHFSYLNEELQCRGAVKEIKPPNFILFTLWSGSSARASHARSRWALAYKKCGKPSDRGCWKRNQFILIRRLHQTNEVIFEGQ